MMPLQANKGLILGAAVFLWVAGCAAPSEPDLATQVSVDPPPVVTGIHVTTRDAPDGTGETIGSPSYEITPGSVNAFPNPFVDVVPDFPFPYAQQFLTFTHLPPEITFVIVRGVAPGEESSGSVFGIPAFEHGSAIVRVLKKNDPFRFFKWDLADESGAIVPSGVYRAFYTGPTIQGTKWIDLSLKLTLIAPGRF